MSDSSMFTAAQASDPSTPQSVLADIARDRPDLRAAVASNPSAYPALIDWLSGLGDPAVDAAIAGRGAGATAPLPPSPVAPAPAYQAAQPPYGAETAGQPIATSPTWDQQPQKSGLSTGAIIGIVVGVLVVLGLLIGGFFVVMGLIGSSGGGEAGSYGDDAYLDGLWDGCAAGDMQACDDLYDESPIGSEYEAFGDTCGGLQDEGTWVYCTEAFGSGTDGSTTTGADTYGDDAYLDGLWDSCAAGDMQACDDLYLESPFDSEYEVFGDTCGGLQSEGTDVYCTEAFGSGTDGSTTTGADTYGDDAYLDGLWDACEAGDNQACDELYAESPFGSEYEEFGDTCAGRNPEGGVYCTDFD